MTLKLGESFLDDSVVMKKFDNRYYDGLTVEIYYVGVPRLYDSYTDLDTGIIIKEKGKELYRNYKLSGYTIEDIVRRVQKDLLAEALKIR